MAATGSPVLPGRLGSAAMTLRDDPRADPRMIAAMEPFGLADPPEPAPVYADSSIEQLLDYVSAAEEGFEALFAALDAGRRRWPASTGPSRSSRVSTATTSPSTSTGPAVLGEGATGGTPPARRGHGAARGRRSGVRPLARRPRRVRPRRRRRRVPQRRGQARSPPVPGRASTTARRRCGGSPTTRLS